ncbi:Alpha/Beta hydrolase protein [Parasitella parasitica]|nr:Alpha/Beta hydrolase protein [Parasitella parasitica]
MLSLFSAFAATSYIFSVLFTSFFILCAFDKPVIRQLFAHSLRKYLFIIEVTSSMVTEFSLQIIFINLVWIKIVGFLGGFNYTLAWLFYSIDFVNFGGLAVLFLEMLKDKSVADETIRSLDNTSKPMASIICFDDLKKLINPIWTPANIKVHPNITYATNEEIRDALETSNQDFSQPRKMMLDIFSQEVPSTTDARLRPVLVHIHGGAWRMGSKDTFYPFQKLMISENNWITVNVGYRLAPKNAYPTHLMDIKRAIRWLKQNISSFGGDPNFIVLSGDSAGAHLACMVSMTTNNPQFQPGFESVDTSVRGVVSLSGSLDQISDPHHALFFCKKVANLDKVDVDFLNQHSPLALVPKTKSLVPFLLVAGERDSLTECKMSKAMKIACDEATAPNSTCTLILLPAGHHVSYISWSPRSLYISRVIQSWCTRLYTKNK